jgi:hypothetical protein
VANLLSACISIGSLVAATTIASAADMPMPIKAPPSLDQPSDQVAPFIGGDFTSQGYAFGYAGAMFAPYGSLDNSGLRLSVRGSRLRETDNARQRPDHRNIRSACLENGFSHALLHATGMVSMHETRPRTTVSSSLSDLGSIHAGEVNSAAHLVRSCPPSKARTIDRPNEFQIRGWPD